MPLLARDVVALAIQVSGIFDADLDLFGDGRVIDRRCERRQREQARVVDFGPLEQVERAGFAGELEFQRVGDLAAQRVVRGGPDRGQARLLALDRLALAFERGEARVVDQPESASDRRQPQVGVVSSRYSAREVNMRYGSIVPCVIRSSISTPM